MLDKLRTLQVKVAPLCPCGLTIDNPDVSRCAQNCVYYRNPTAVHRAIESIYNSIISS
jgi:hypothetical protein